MHRKNKITLEFGMQMGIYNIGRSSSGLFTHPLQKAYLFLRVIRRFGTFQPCLVTSWHWKCEPVPNSLTRIQEVHCSTSLIPEIERLGCHTVVSSGVIRSCFCGDIVPTVCLVPRTDVPNLTKWHTPSDSWSSVVSIYSMNPHEKTCAALFSGQNVRWS